METKKIVILIFFLATIAYTVVSLFKIITTSAPDFHVFYYSAYDLINGINPYEDKSLTTGLGYPVATSLFYVPFLVLPFPIAQGLFVFFSALAVPILVYITLLVTQKKVSWDYFLFFTSLAFLSFPTKFTLGMGQSNLLADLLIIGSFYFYKKTEPVQGGILLGLALVVKPLLGFLVLFFLLKKAWRTLSIAGVVITLFIVPTLVVYGLDIYIYYVTQLIPHLLNLEGREIYYNQGVVGFLARLTDDIFIRKTVSTIVSIFLTGAASYVILKKNVNDEIKFSILLVALLLIDTLAWQHHFVFLIFPYVVVYMSIRRRRQSLLTLSLLVLSYLMVSYNIKSPESLYGAPFSFVLSHVFFGTVILLLLLLMPLFRRKKNNVIV